MVPSAHSPERSNGRPDAESAIADELVRRLRAQGNALAADPVLVEQLRAQVGVILQRTRDRLSGTAVDAARPAGGERVGRARAGQNIHPVDSLTAATLLFDIALTELQHDGDAVEVARALNASIMDEVVPAALGYVDVLLERIAVADAEEHLGIWRRLHVPSPETAGGALAAGTESTGILTDRELQVITMIAQAYTNREISARLHIAEGTVKRHTTNIYAKLGATSRIDAVRTAVRLGLLRG
ncbi:response regulator transcription factor [Leifsonia sp. 22587]|uniref:helix-turn-helix transcriptional regulator n=1 Tax=Leifsonia sp. 22587 TaxID=3453946 RepID=UPI003F875E09